LMLLGPAIGGGGRGGDMRSLMFIAEIEEYRWRRWYRGNGQLVVFI